MTVSNAVEDVFAMAQAAYDAGRYQEGAVFHLRAGHLACTHGQSHAGFSHRLIAAICWKLAGFPLRGLTLLCHLVADPRAAEKSNILRMARQQMFRIVCDFRPQLDLLQQQLQSLRQEAQGRSSWQTDRLYLEGYLAEAQGRWTEALSWVERAIGQKHNGHKFMMFQIVALALRLCLRLRHRKDAENWCQVLAETEPSFSESRVAYEEARARLVLFDQDFNHLSCVIEQLILNVKDLQRPTWHRKTAIVVARAALLDVKHGDPWTPTHPARQVLTHRNPEIYEVADRYERHLLLVDYQLAAIRYLLGIPPIDDWYVPISPYGCLAKEYDVSKRADFFRRAEAAQRAMRTAFRYAARVDRAFQSTWRTQEIQERTHRLERLLGVHYFNFCWRDEKP